MQRWRVSRERVVERIRRAGAHRIVLLLAEAGYGKSVAVRQVLEGEAEPHAFYRVAPQTTTLLGFLRGLTEALEPFVPGAHLSFTIAHERAMQSPLPHAELATWLGEHLRDVVVRIAIDDLHNATDDAIGDFLARAIDASPRAVRWLIATRPSKTFSPASWLAQREMDWPIDDSELRFTSGEVGQIAQSAGLALSPRAFDAVLRASDGWPSAAGLALLHAETLPALEIATARTEVYDTLAKLVFEALDQDAQRFLLETSVFPVMDHQVLHVSGWNFQGLMDAPGWDGPYVEEVSAGQYRYDSLFRDFLLRTLQDLGGGHYREALVKAAVAYERGERIPDALRFYAQAGASAALSRLLALHGLALIEQGESDIVESAIAALSDDEQHGIPAILGLKAILDSHAARFDTAEAWFRLALHQLDDERLRLSLTYRYSLDLIRRGRMDCVEILEPAISSALASNHELYPLLCCTLATAYVAMGRNDEARALVDRAIGTFGPSLSNAQRARAYHQAAYVALRCGEIRDAANYAHAVIEIAAPAGLYDLAARAYSILYEIAHVWDATPRKALEYIENVAAFAMRSGDAHVRAWALMGAYYIEAERGGGTIMTSIERSLNTADLLQMAEEATAALLPGQALRATWTGDFLHAYRLLAPTAAEQSGADRRGLRFAEVALYAAAAGLPDEAGAALAEARRELPEVGRTKYGVQAIVFTLLTLSMLGDVEAWATLRRKDSRLDGLSLSLSALVRIADLLHAHWAEKRNHAGVLAALADLRRHDLGGLATMIEALPANPSKRVSSASLP